MRKLLLGLLLLPLWANATTYYMKPFVGGPYGTADGLSLANAFRGGVSTPCGGGGLVSGDTLLVSGNWSAADSYNGVSIFGPYCSGAVGNVITYDFTNATFNCGDSATVKRGIETNIAINITLKNPNITHCWGRGINMTNSNDNTVVANITIESPTVTYIGFNNAGYAADTPTAIWGKGKNLTVHNPMITWTAHDGVWLDGDNSYVYADSWAKGVIQNVGESADLAGDCVQLGGSGATSPTAKVQGIYCDHRSQDEKQCIIANGTGQLIVRDNACIANTVTTPNLSHCLYSDGVVFATHNYFQGCANGFFLAAGVGVHQIFGNIITGFGQLGINNSTASGAILNLFNNTIDCTKGFAAVGDISVRGVNVNPVGGGIANVYNNTVFNCGIGLAGGGAGTKNGTNNAGSGNLQNFNGCCSTGFVAAVPAYDGTLNRMLPQGYRPPATSTLCKAGSTAVAFPGLYYDGQRISSPPDIGALACVH